MKKRLEKVLATVESMRDQLQERIDNAGDSDAAQEAADRNQTVLDCLESAITEIESAIAEYEAV